MPPQRTFGRTQSGPAAFGAISNDASAAGSDDSFNSTKPKRRADFDLGDVTKRPRPDSSRDITTFFSTRHQLTGISTSKTGLVIPTTSSTRPIGQPAAFAVQRHGISGTQDTIKASTQEQHRPLSPSRSKSSEAPLPEIPPIAAPTQRTKASLFVNPTAHNATVADIPLEEPSGLYHHLNCIWPTFPSWLREAPFPVAWEVTRIAQKCKVDLNSTDLTYSPSWTDQKVLRAALWTHPAFQGKAFPESSSEAAWAASLEQSSLLPFDQQVVYSVSLDFGSKSDPLRLTIQPLKLDQSHRLGRRFGADRFLELLFPSPDTFNLPGYMRKNDNESFFNNLVKWLTVDHSFCGRQWKAFYTKSGGSRKPVKRLQFGPEPKPVYRDCVYLFAENAESHNFIRTSLHSMLDWVLEFGNKDNRSQPVLKLFQRISLVLSKTSPTVVFEPTQIRNKPKDLLSPTKNIMNDGVARMSPAVARRIRACLGLTTTPSAVQGRLGGAKGMWIVDVSENSDKIWIETYPSQRKWELDWSRAHEEHRTLEIKNVASIPKSASFNLQFLPVLEDRALNKTEMRETIGKLLQDNIQDELEGQKRALQSPMQFRQWTHENGSYKNDRLIHGHIPYLGGMPQEDEEVMNCMLDAGFDPKSNALLNEIAYAMQKRKCETLMKKLNIRVGRSAYLYMVVDFEGVLEENEVHIGFSTAFDADENWSKTMVQGTDVLVARSPAHFTSDIQKVKAVFKPELSDLTDVIIFSSKGNVPLADKLSGGDYDGDLAWICWDSRIVNNFENAEVQDPTDLSQYMTKDKETFTNILSRHPNALGKASLRKTVSEMILKSFKFNLSKSMLGICTNYKERLCYKRNNVCDETAKMLSTLLGQLVDQAKQGIQFTAEDFQQLKRDFNLPIHVDDPYYKKEHWVLRDIPLHIIDYLKFKVAQPTIANELKAFHTALNQKGSTHWDQDLSLFYKDYVGQAEPQNDSMGHLLDHLRDDIQAVATQWDSLSSGSIGFPERVTRTYELWQDIQPHKEIVGGYPTNEVKVGRLVIGGEISHWALLKASMAFWMFCNSNNSRKYRMKPRFVWQMACRQLCCIKAMMTNSKGMPGAAGAPTVTLPEMYAALRPDSKFIKQRKARMQGEGSQFSQGMGYSGGYDVGTDDDD